MERSEEKPTTGVKPDTSSNEEVDKQAPYKVEPGDKTPESHGHEYTEPTDAERERERIEKENEEYDEARTNIYNAVGYQPERKYYEARKKQVANKDFEESLEAHEGDYWEFSTPHVRF